MMFTAKKKSEPETAGASASSTSTPVSTPTAAAAVPAVRKVPEEPRPAPVRSSHEEICPPSQRPTSRPGRSNAVSPTSSTMNPHLSFEGNLKYAGTLTVDCEFRGSIVTDDTLVVGPAARITAELTAGVIEVSGKVHGNMKAKSRVKILAGGEVYGNIETPTISMDEGVVFEGNCTRSGGSQPAPRSRSSDVDQILQRADEVLATNSA